MMGLVVLLLLIFAAWRIYTSIQEANYQEERRAQQQLEKRLRKERELELVPLQNFLFGYSCQTLVVTEARLNQALQEYITCQRKSMLSCEAALNTTASPVVFFSKYDELMMIERSLEALEKAWNRPVIASFATEADFSQLRNDMINRFWKDCVQKSINARSSKSKMDRIHAFFDTLSLYNDHLDEQNHRQIDAYREPAMNLFMKYI